MTDFPPRLMDQILPPNATVYERTLASEVDRILSLDVDEIRRLWDPHKVKPELLPYLAWALSVDIWNSNWPVQKKRAVVAASFQMHSHKGTRLGLKEYLGLVDTEILRIVVPPAITTPRTPLTSDQRAQWASQFPELRVYYYRNRVVRHGLMVAGRCWFGSRRIARRSTASEHAGRRAFLERNGTETQLSIRVMPGTTEFVDGYIATVLPSQGQRFRPGYVLSSGQNRFVRKSTAESRSFSYTDGNKRYDVIPPGSRPLDTRPDKISQRAVLPTKMVAGRPLFGSRRRILRTSTAKERVYDSLRIFDGEFVADNVIRPRGGWFVGTSRLGQPAFHAEVMIDASYKRLGRRAFPGVVGGILRSHDGSRMAEICEAVRASKAERDKISLRSSSYHIIQVQDEIPLDGSYQLGQMIRRI